MKAVVYEQFGRHPEIQLVADPAPAPDGVVSRVGASGVCRSDWHGWVGHDPDIALPHVPGHEIAGTVVAAVADVTRWREGDRVTIPFVAGCGRCPECQAGQQQVCRDQFQPGFSAWGSFAPYVSLRYAEQNLVRLPDSLDFVTAASLGCRFATSFRAVVHQGRVRGGQWVAIHGCGGVGMSAVMIARSLGARVIAVDIGADTLAAAAQLGAEVTLNSREVDVVAAILDVTGGGAHLSLDALGHPRTCSDSIRCLRTQGRHVQVGLLLADQSRPSVPMDIVVAKELMIYGSHGMQAHAYPEMLAMITGGLLSPERLLGARLTLEESIAALTRMDTFDARGVQVIDRFD